MHEQIHEQPSAKVDFSAADVIVSRKVRAESHDSSFLSRPPFGHDDDDDDTVYMTDCMQLEPTN